MKLFDVLKKSFVSLIFLQSLNPFMSQASCQKELGSYVRDLEGALTNRIFDPSAPKSKLGGALFGGREITHSPKAALEWTLDTATDGSVRGLGSGLVLGLGVALPATIVIHGVSIGKETVSSPFRIVKHLQNKRALKLVKSYLEKIESIQNRKESEEGLGFEDRIAALLLIGDQEEFFCPKIDRQYWDPIGFYSSYKETTFKSPFDKTNYLSNDTTLSQLEPTIQAAAERIFISEVKTLALSLSKSNYSFTGKDEKLSELVEAHLVSWFRSDDEKSMARQFMNDPASSKVGTMQWAIATLIST